MASASIGVFGGSGFYEFLDNVEELHVDTPYGPPSARIRVGEIDGTPVAFMPRHGDEHTLPPHRINYRANVWAMRHVGVRRIIGPSADLIVAPELAFTGYVPTFIDDLLRTETATLEMLF